MSADGHAPAPEGRGSLAPRAIRRCLFVGLGGIGQRHLRNLRALLGDEPEVIAFRTRRERHTLDDSLSIVAGVDVERKYDVRVVGDLETALGLAPELVFVTNPSSLHVPVAEQAARAGCHLFIEKPVASSLEGVGRLEALVREQSLVTLVAYQLRWHPGFVRLRELLRQRAVGRLLSVRAEVGEYLPGFHPYEDYRRMYAAQKELGGGVTLSQIHEIDYLYALFGFPRRVFSMGGQRSSLELDVDDVAESLLEFANPDDAGPLWVSLHQDFVQRPARREASVVGERGRIEWSLSGKTLRVWDETGRLCEAHDYAELPRNRLYQDELAHFVECVRERRPSALPLGEGVQSLRVALALLESQRTGQPVELGASEGVPA